VVAADQWIQWMFYSYGFHQRMYSALCVKAQRANNMLIHCVQKSMEMQETIYNSLFIEAQKIVKCTCIQRSIPSKYILFQ
jgi:hypothetical protein